jgi:HAAS domain-containing protein
MNPVTRYVKEVEKSLSGQNFLRVGRLRISAMIYKDLSRQVDALETKLGREPSDGEVTALLAEFGPAAEVAARYTEMAARTPSHDLMERYLAAVERRLPKEQAADIVAELREALEARIDAKSEELGRAAGPDEVAAILKEFGHPTLAASRYQTQQYLIGPGLYPWFWPAQRMALGVTLAVLVVLTVIRVLDSARPLSAFIGRVFAWWEPLAMVFGLVTLVFMLMEQAKTPVKLAQGWNPKTLPHDNVRKPRPLFDSVFALGFDVVFILWWIGVITVPGRKDASVQFDFTGVWDSVHTPILALALVTAAVHAADIVYPAWSRLRSAVSIAGHVGGLAVMAVLLQADKLITVTELPNGDTRAAQLSWWLDGPFRLVLFFVAVGWAIGLCVEIWRQVRAGHPAGPARGAPPAASAPA